MRISDLEVEKKVKELFVEVISIIETETTETNKKVQEIIVADDTGQVKMKLWEEDINQYPKGTKIEVYGFCKSFENELFITKGIYGKIKIVK